MKNTNDPLGRLLRSASAEPCAQPERAAVPWSVEQRVLAALRSGARQEDFSWLAPLLRRAFTAAGALVVALAFLALHDMNTSVAAAQPAHELSVVDQELAFALLP